MNPMNLSNQKKPIKSKKPDHRNIEKDTKNNIYYRKVIYTLPEFQLVLMSLNPGEDIPLEIHKQTTQFIRIESGYGQAIINKKKYILKDGVSIIVPPNTYHYIQNTSKTKPMKLYSIYTPAEHPKHKLNKRQR